MHAHFVQSQASGMPFKQKSLYGNALQSFTAIGSNLSTSLSLKVTTTSCTSQREGSNNGDWSCKNKDIEVLT